jgi:muramoyltetrapeptide carboxypeptidase
MTLIRPPKLRPGDLVGIVAASSPVDRERFSAGAAVLASRYDLRYDESSLFARSGFLAGDDSCRLQALNAAIADPELRAVILARGGYGLTRILAGVDWTALRAHAKPIVGYSDATALLALCARVRVTAVHGPMVNDFADLDVRDRDSLFNLLENPEPGEICTHLTTLVGGVAEGSLLGGNLEVLTRLLGTDLQPNLDGAVLFLEDIGERPYRVDRALTHLEMAGALAGLAGVVVGDFTDCDETKEGKLCEPSITDVLGERLGRLPVPVAIGGSFGHGERKNALPYGVRVRLDAGAGVLSALDGVVS